MPDSSPYSRVDAQPVNPYEEPDKAAIYNLDTREKVTVQFNPTQITSKFKAHYSKQKVPGASHEPLQYDYSTNEEWSFELVFVVNTPDDVDALRYKVAFLQSLMVRWKGKARPPRTLFVVGDEIAVVCAITDLEKSRRRFNRKLQTTYQVCKLTLEEDRDVPLWGDDLMKTFDVRGSVGGK